MTLTSRDDNRVAQFLAADLECGMAANVRTGWTAVAAFCAATLAGCSVPAAAPATCVGGRHYGSEFGAAATPMDALKDFLASSDGAGMNAGGWAQTQASGTQVAFRSGGDQAIVVEFGDGWVVGPYTTCAT